VAHDPAQQNDERSWVEQAKAGDPEAFGLLYEKYFDRIYKYVYLKIGDATEAEDLTEQVFLKMIEAIHTFQWQGTTFAAWLYRIAHNQVVDTIRQHSRRPQTSLEPVVDVIPSEKDDPYQLAELSNSVTHLKEAIGNLTDLQAQVISMKFGMGLTNAEVAGMLDRTEGAVKALQYSALQNLSKAMALKGWP
jgi:RNA polymerase sigma-70 factor (ECF subfamily)